MGRRHQMNDDVVYVWQSTPGLWAAMRPGYCGCGECHCPMGLGETKDAARESLEEEEEMRDEA